MDDKIKKHEIGGLVARTGNRRVAQMVFVGKPEGTRQPGRHRQKWEENIKMAVQEM